MTPDWTERHRAFVRAAALEPKVERIFVNAAIKKALCREAKEAINPNSRKIAVDFGQVDPSLGEVMVPVAEFYKRCECPPDGSCMCGRRGKATVSIGKQRNGPAGVDVDLTFISKYARFEDRSERSEY